ncbi:MAG: RHS repeat-associated core domain-containing protein, partial [Myxococcota bacterium]
GVTDAVGTDSALPEDGDFRHHGMWLDPTGLYYARNRTYDAETGRFTSRDPVEPGTGEPEAWSPFVANRANPFVFRDPEGLFTLRDIGVALRIENILSNVNRIAAQEAFDFLKDEALGAAADAFIAAIGAYLPAGPLDFPGSETIEDIRGSVLGNEFESLLQGGVCDFLPLADTGPVLYLQVPMNRRTGRPSGRGFPCPNPSTSEVPRVGNTRVNSFPDFLFSGEDPGRFARDDNLRSYLVAEIKLRPQNIRTGSNQFRTIVRHADEWSYAPVAAYLTLRPPTARKRASINRRARRIARRRGGSMSVQVVSIL